MNMRSVISKAIVVTLWFSMPYVLSAQTQDLSLKHGTYVPEGVSCNEPPFAAIRSWDGAGFSGPHSSQCITRVFSRHGNQFKVSTTCAALGDGTPDKSGEIESLSLTRLSGIRFVVHNAGKAETRYRWCGAK